ncbi:MAG: hypothetical protein U0804_21240 [Gemmataceae bacterium]
MTPTINATKTAPVARTAEAEQLLRDAAFVLKMTRRVKAEIVRDAAGLRTAPQAAERAGTALGV